ncbi:MAG: PocR ligand-binding domain-containing protein [Clostridia bacterium]|nr:PocR ligand-binding domain-containing protein [Clostridia bacterium]
MSLKWQNTELMELMQDFYTLTGIRLVLFDADHRELASYPSAGETFCACMRTNELFDRQCRESDKRAFDRCRQTRALHIDKCHAGLTEATVPILEGERILGYMMFGQITDRKNKEETFETLSALVREYGIQGNLEGRIKKIKYRNEQQIRSASKIMEACTAYVRLKDIVQPSGKQLIDSIERFVEEHIREEIDVDRICREFDISRTRLYETIRPYTEGGIASFVKRKRLEYAKYLIRTTDRSIPEIASAAGFSDYNYFLRVFKKQFGVSSKTLRKN